MKWSESGGGWSRESVRRCSIKKFTVSGRALVLRLSVVISIKVGGIPPTTRVDNIRNLARRHFAAHGHHLFCWPRAIGSRPFITLRLPQPRVRHIFAPLPCASTPKNRDSGWSGGKLDWLHQGMQVPKLSLLTSPAPRIGKTSVGTTRRESAFRESLCETTPLRCLCLQTSTYLGWCLCFSTTCARMIQDTSRLNLTSTLQVHWAAAMEPWKAVASLRGGTRYICSTANENDTDASGFEQSRPLKSFAPRLIRPLNARIRGHSDL